MLVRPWWRQVSYQLDSLLFRIWVSHRFLLIELIRSRKMVNNSPPKRENDRSNKKGKNKEQECICFCCLLWTSRLTVVVADIN